MSVQRVFQNLIFSEPVAMLQAPGDNSRWFILERIGRILVFDNSQTVATAQVFLDIRDRVVEMEQSEAGLLGLAFHPNFASNGRVYVNYIDHSVRSVTSEFTSSDGRLTLNPNSERVLLTVNKPADNHNGGQLNFGPDGLLYLGLGDGGGGGDPQGNAQNPMRLLGKMLRIDVNAQPGGQPYGIPADNPFAVNPRCNVNGTGTQNCPEIYALGLRNPWRWSFDRQTGTQWVADVGQGQWEEINIVTRGGNYGWNHREGAHCSEPENGCQTPGLIDPVGEYDRSMGFAITGGYVYRGPQTTSLVGRYIFADFGSGMIASLTPSAGGTYTIAQHVQPGSAPTGAPGQLMISAFGESNDGELYLLDYVRGHIYRLVFTASGGVGSGYNVPQQLSATGCINTSSPGAPPLSSLIPYRLNAGFWSDGVGKDRWIGLPNGQNISVQANGDWNFPNGTVLVKHFRDGNQLIETRLFMRHPDGVWAGYTYQWNQAQTEATRITGGGTASVGGQTWTFPSEGQCMQCHTQAAGFVLGLETAQQNGHHLYPQTGRTANQLTTLNAVGVLSPPVGANPPAYADPSDTGRSLTDRARSYLHANCANCHRPGGPTGVNLDLRHDTLLSQTGACDVLPSRGELGIANARIIAPGDYARSVLHARMNRRNDPAMMPPIASSVIDTAGEQLMRAWIDSLTAASCQ
ncbi:MAG: PQQ-dependent sugar dehydrogenase [Nitrospira sp.]|nr:PQQ-dependent sugar dehydrogenase [Nitrospira sp.]